MTASFAVPPIVMNCPTFAMWLYGPIGAGVFGGVDVSTLVMAEASDSFGTNFSPRSCRHGIRTNRNR